MFISGGNIPAIVWCCHQQVLVLSLVTTPTMAEEVILFTVNKSMLIKKDMSGFD
jgi:hypothetical protein